MGTNYYWYEKADCDKCGRPFEGKHIGKSSWGWVFSLHVYPIDNINNLKDWQDIWNGNNKGFIRNEYGEKISVDEMEDIILNREKNYREIRCDKKAKLLRHTDKINVIGTGKTWDCIDEDFA